MSFEKKATIAFIAFILFSVIWVLSHPEPRTDDCEYVPGAGRTYEVYCP